jgi:enolase-phosphatase E1
VIVFSGQVILLDVEGTTSSIDFVYDVLFGYAKEHVAAFLQTHLDDDEIYKITQALAQETGIDADIRDSNGCTQIVLAAIDLMNKDVKSTPLKALQGRIWKTGFQSGQLVSHVFDDVPSSLADWSTSGIDIRIYSSGSIDAQKLFFRHTAAGDLTTHLRGHYDTTTGPKREQESYLKISNDIGVKPEHILFLSDIGAELDAARAVGMATGATMRPGNQPFESLYDHEHIHSFADVTF